ncbi:hypothetical protein M422DRAFT_231403 [Sphaerobolus stellatus SS14]|uniref:Protein-S-isoprenylcysteine O-methyltransferase n=1 Tax=Sphaerobolus stellatus (strain SS14) TaxID=990650 RepID=A0A0C9VKK3_SPHS4|nr:hypothetical protein M422DRAFT_231403 [Sphaerobolus stellatus SS14]
MTLLRLPFVLVAAASMHIAVTPPRTATPDEQVKSSTFREAFLTRFVIMSHLLTVSLIWFIVLGESATILSPYRPSISGVSLRTPPTTLPLAFVMGSLLITSAGLLRWLCYRTLGRFFTFELSIQKDHRLVTEGPYSFVRHPSYTGTLLLALGLFLMHGSSDSWLRTSGILDFTPMRILFMGWGGTLLAITASVFARAAHEDRLMRDQFGEEWDRWASVVRYRIVPGIY